MIKQGISKNQAKTVYLGIGSNLGNKKFNIEVTKFLIESFGIKILKSSSLYESKSWPDPSMPKFINLIIKVKTNLSPFKLLKVCNLIEKKLGRKRSKRNSPRTCDIDIIDYNKIVLEKKNRQNLIIPHISLTNRNFVLIPLFEIDKNWKHPKTKANIVKLINSLRIDELRSIKKI